MFCLLEFEFIYLFILIKIFIYVFKQIIQLRHISTYFWKPCTQYFQDLPSLPIFIIPWAATFIPLKKFCHNNSNQSSDILISTCLILWGFNNILFFPISDGVLKEFQVKNYIRLGEILSELWIINHIMS